MNNPLRVIVRVWKKEKTPILIFPDWEEHKGYYQMWEPVGQHGAGDYKGIVKKTLPASDEEAASVISQYEKYYQCKLSKLIRIKKFIQRRR